MADECNDIAFEIFNNYVHEGDRNNPVYNGIMNRNTYSDGKSDFEILAERIKKCKALSPGAIATEEVQLSIKHSRVPRP